MNDEDMLLIREIYKKVKEINMKKKALQEKYGYVKNIIYCNINDHNFIAVGNKLLWNKNWITFPDFLMDYLKFVLGKEWWDVNISKTEEKTHPIINWHRKMIEFQKLQKVNRNGFFETEVNATMLSYLLLAYDLYTIEHNFELQKQVINRLKSNDQFQGARFELFVASIFIRAGFIINYSDESDRSTKHPEFIAKIPQTGQLLAVEAKSRHRDGEQGKINQQMKLGITRLINRALKKSPNQPFVIFIDLNLPVTKKHQRSNFKQLVSEFNKSYEKNSINDKFNLIFFSDHNPCSKQDNSMALTFNDPLIAVSNKPGFIIKKSDFVLSRIKKSISQFGKIPNYLSEMDFNNSIELNEK